MTSSSAARRATLLLVAAVAFVPGCATRSRILPKPALIELTPDSGGPQTAGTAIRWTARATGGVGELEYAFHQRLGEDESAIQTGPSATWAWTPAQAGVYQIRVVVRDTLGYEVRGPWSTPYEIVPALAAGSPLASRESPLRARTADVYWNTEASGGVPPLSYEFHLEQDGVDRIEQTGEAATWTWAPRRRGLYRVKTVVLDAIGNSIDGGWSGLFRIEPAVSHRSPIAVLPLEDVTARGAPVAALRTAILNAMLLEGLRPLDETVLNGFLARYRVRHVGGLHAELSQALEEETGAAAVLVTAVEQYADEDPPRFTLTCRLTSAGEKNSVLWMESVASAGHESPGLLELGRIRDIEVLRDQASTRLARSLDRYVASEERGRTDFEAAQARLARNKRRKSRPTGFYRSPDSSLGTIVLPRIAVLPFENETSRAEAGRILMLQFVEQLANRPDVDVVEPGDVRHALLQARLVLKDGPSLSQTDLLRSLLGVDLVIAGTVTEYEERGGEESEPVVGFSVQGIAASDRRIVWTSLGYARGDDGVVFFDAGRTRTAHELASGLAGRIVAEMMAGSS